MKSPKVFTIVAVLLSLLLLAATNTAEAQQFTGAVYTSLKNGTQVNANIYNLVTDVYINGGPQTTNAAGLPNGTYYFQVTDPSGATLLSTDNAVCRQLQVIGDAVAGGAGPCPHPNGDFNIANGSTPVQLAPFNFTPNSGGEYKAWLISQDSQIGCAPTIAADNKTLVFPSSCAKTDNFKIRQTGEGGQSEVVISGVKFYDANTNGNQDQGEPGIIGWRIDRVPPEPSAFTYTLPPGGQYTFSVPQNSGEFTISETPPPPGWFPIGVWFPTTATSGKVTVGASSVAGPNFGNVCLGAGGGRTLGFWSNKNGQALFGPDDLALMVSLNLVDSGGNPFNPAGYAAFRTWLLGATATNMAYMLSAQLAAMELNVYNGLVSGSALIYAPGTNSANAAGFATVTSIMAEANTELGLHGLVLAGSEFRAYQEALKNALDRANNNVSFVQPGPGSCPPIPVNY